MTAPRSKRPEWQPFPGRSKLERIALNSLSLAGWELDQAAASTDPESVFVHLKYGLKYMDEFLRFYERSKGVGGRKVGNCHRSSKGPCSNGRKLLSDMRLAQAAKEQGL